MTLPVVDPHVRLDAPPADRGADTDALAPLRRLLDRSGGCHLLRAVHVQGDLDRSDALTDAARVQAIAHTPGSGGLPHGIVACCELTGDGVDERLDALARHPNLRGVRPPAGSAPPTDLAPLERRDLVLELGTDALPVGELVWLATAHPGCRIVLYDRGPWHGEGEADGARRQAARQRLGALGNVVLKLGYRETRDPPDAGEASGTLGALVDHALDAFGPERVMLASGVGAVDTGRPWHATWHAFAVATRGLAARRRDALFRTNAARVYRL